jgi:hypothetical protein
MINLKLLLLSKSQDHIYNLPIRQFTFFKIYKYTKYIKNTTPMNTDPDHLHYLTAATPAAEGGVAQPALAVKDRGERSVCRKVPSVADSSA